MNLAIGIQMLHPNRNVVLTKQEFADLHRRAARLGRPLGQVSSARELLRAILQSLSADDLKQLRGRVLELIDYYTADAPKKDCADEEEFASYLVELILQTYELRGPR